MMRLVSNRAVAVFVACAVVMATVPRSAHATSYTLSNGVTIQEEYVASSSGGVRAFRVSWNGESMVVQSTTGPMYQRIDVDGLFVEFHYRLNQSNERVLDYSTVEYGQWTATRDASQLVTIDPCHPDYGCPEEQLHPNAQSQLDILGYAVSQMHSQGFWNAVTQAYESGEMQAMNWVECFIAVLWYISSWGGIASCVAVWPCAFAILNHVAAATAVGCYCGGYC